MPLDYIVSKRSVIPLPPIVARDAPPARAGRPSLPDAGNVQGDVYMMFSKRAEDFIFFIINDVAKFKSELLTFQPTTSERLYRNLERISEALGEASRGSTNVKRVELVQTQIAFSRKGLDFLGEKGKIQDLHFDSGPMRNEKDILGDMAQWDSVFDSKTVHGVILVATDTVEQRDQETASIKAKFGSSIKGVVVISGQSRPDIHRHDEHFGYRDGIAQPALRGLVNPHKGQTQVDPGVIIMGYPGDPVFDDANLPARPGWTKDGSLMVFRKLEQDVLEFDAYLEKNGPNWRKFVPGGTANPPLSAKEGAELFGAQMVGRWKSGTPLALAPIRDSDPSIGSDPERNDDFDYSIPGTVGPSNRDCPFFSHTRKTNPRNLDPYVSRRFIESSAIIRAAITYGPEVTPAERSEFSRLTPQQRIDRGNRPPPPDRARGLLFVCYQSSLNHGFFLQTTGFANNDYFPITSLLPQKHGQDPIIGGPPPPPSVIRVTGTNIPSKGQITVRVEGTANGTVEVSGFAKPIASGIQEDEQGFFVTSRGGEYFFVPSVSTLQRLARLPGGGDGGGGGDGDGGGPSTFTPRPTTKGVYRIKLWNRDVYMENIYDHNPYLKMSKLDTSGQTQKWIITPGTNNTYTITSLQPSYGLHDSKKGYRGYGFPLAYDERASDTWQVQDQTSGSDKFSKITVRGKPHPLEACTEPGFPFEYVRFNQNSDTPNQRWVFQLLEQRS